MDENEILKFTVTITFEQYYSEDTSWGCFGFSTKDDIPFYIQETKEFDPFENIQTDSDKKFSKLVTL